MRCGFKSAAGATILFFIAVAGKGRAAERSVYFYSIGQTSESEWRGQLQKWNSEGIQRAIVSLETGPKLLIEDQSEAYRLVQLFNMAVLRGIRLDGLILQDPGWALDPDGARQRLDVVLDFEQLHPGLIDAVQIDVEVYTAPQMFCQSEGWSRFGSLVTALRDELRSRSSRVQLSAAIPWWLGYALSEDQLKIICQPLDSLLLMAYGDPGGPPIAADLATFIRKVRPAIEALSGHGPALRVAIAKYEHKSALMMARFAQELDDNLITMAGFTGISYFHDTTPFMGAI